MAMNTQEIDEHDRRMTAVHEAGHVVVAAHYGARCDAIIWHDPTERPHEQSTWCGRSRTWPKALGPLQEASIGAAGVTAEMLNRSSTVTVQEITDAIEYGAVLPSETDWETMKAVGSYENTNSKLYRVVSMATKILRQHSCLMNSVVSQLCLTGHIDGRDVLRSIRKGAA